MVHEYPQTRANRRRRLRGMWLLVLALVGLGMVLALVGVLHR